MASATTSAGDLRAGVPLPSISQLPNRSCCGKVAACQSPPSCSSPSCTRFIRRGYQILTTLHPIDDAVHERTGTMAAMDDLGHSGRIVVAGTNAQTVGDMSYTTSQASPGNTG